MDLVIETPNSSARSCSATFTNVVSTTDMTEPSTTVPAIIQVARSTRSAGSAFDMTFPQLSNVT